MTDGRLAAIEAWLKRIGKPAGSLSPASDDASFRRYFRLHGDGSSFIVMDAPPPQEDVRPFIDVAAALAAIGLNAPRVMAADVEQGFLLLTDLGERQYLDALRDDPALAASLYSDAVRALLRLQQQGNKFVADLPAYDETLLRSELDLFHDWLCGTHLGLNLSTAEQAGWQAVCRVLIDNALSQPQVFVHRDYHSRNLMVTPDDNPGLLDFQDAVSGPLTYDLVSLLKDCYIRWQPAARRERALEFYAGLDARLRKDMDEAEFERRFDLMGVHRHLKAAGIFCRLNHRDGKGRYLDDVPQTLSYIVEVAPRYEALAPLLRLLEDRVLPRWAGAG